MPTTTAIREQVTRIRKHIKTQRDLLHFVIEEFLAGRQVTGKTIGLDFFHYTEEQVFATPTKKKDKRPTHPRVAMKELREGLEEFYLGPGFADSVHISFKRGSHTPIIRLRFGELSERSRTLLRRAGEAREQRSASGYSEVIRLYKEINMLEGREVPLVLARLAEVHALRVLHAVVPARPEMELARDYASKALGCSDRLWAAHIAMGAYHACINWDWENAKTSFAAAIEIGGDKAKIIPWNITMYNALGDSEELIDFLEDRMSDLDDTHPLIRRNLGTALMLSGRYEEALHEYESSFPHYLAHAYQAMIYDVIGKPEKALEQARMANERPDSHFRGRGVLVMALGKAGKHKEAREELSSLESRSEYLGRFELAVAHMGFADYGAVLKYLEEAAEEREYLILFLPHWPMFKAIHGHPRFQQLLAKMKLPPPRSTEP